MTDRVMSPEEWLQLVRAVHDWKDAALAVLAPNLPEATQLPQDTDRTETASSWISL
jgi:hypothetical protein